MNYQPKFFEVVKLTDRAYRVHLVDHAVGMIYKDKDTATDAWGVHVDNVVYGDEAVMRWTEDNKFAHEDLAAKRLDAALRNIDPKSIAQRYETASAHDYLNGCHGVA